MARAVLVYELTRLENELRLLVTVDAVRRSYSDRSVFERDVNVPDGHYKVGLMKIRSSIRNCGISISDCLRSESQDFVFRDDDIVIIYGEDGDFVNIAKLLNNQKIITVATPVRKCGRLMIFTVDSFVEKSAEILSAEYQTHEKVSISLAETSTGQRLEAVNDFHVGRTNISSSRYAVLQGETWIPQTSSGVIFSTGTGSTGWEMSARYRDDKYRTRPLSDHRLCMLTRELCFGDRIQTGYHSSPVVMMSEDLHCRVVADGVLDDAKVLILSSGATVTITPNHRSVRMCI